MKLFKKIKKVNSKYINKVKYYSYYKKMKIDPEIIYLESQQGRTLNGNMFYILKELITNKEYKSYKKYKYCNPYNLYKVYKPYKYDTAKITKFG